MRENVYISGPMTGYIEHNYPTFNAAAAILREQGHTVLNPAEHFGGDHDRKRSEYLRADIKDILQNATAVCLLPGWETSPGAILEVALAYNIGILNYLEVDFIERTATWVGYLDHVVDKLPEQVLPAKEPDTMAPEGSMQPTWWKYQGSFLDPTGTGSDIEGDEMDPGTPLHLLTSDHVLSMEELSAHIAVCPNGCAPPGILGPEEDELTRVTLDEAPVPLLTDDECRVCFHGPHGKDEAGSCQELESGGNSNASIKTACGCTEYVDLEAESRITIPDPYSDDFVEAPDADPTDAISPKETILEEAQRIVLGPRQSSYSHPSQDFFCTGRQWGALVDNWLLAEGYGVFIIDEDGKPLGPIQHFPDIAPRIVALMMAALKASREAHKPKRDNRVDGAGYWFCADRVETGE